MNLDNPESQYYKKLPEVLKCVFPLLFFFSSFFYLMLSHHCCLL